MMINCEKASELISKNLDIKLSFWEKMTLKFHTLMCSACSLFEDEANTLTKAIHHEHKEHTCSKTMSTEGKKKLENILNSEKK